MRGRTKAKINYSAGSRNIPHSGTGISPNNRNNRRIRGAGCGNRRRPRAFLSADMDEEVIMTIRGRLVELMVKSAPNIYRKYITLDANNQSILYVKLQKALYGCLRSALLFYEKLVS
jgi:hypothetical protein